MPSTTSTKLVAEPLEVENRLRELDLSREALEESVRIGELERAAATELDPPSFGGIAGWALTIRTLRARLLGDGRWRYSNAGNLPLTINAARKIAIAVLLGSRGTGDVSLAKEGLIPTTKWPKGVAMTGQVRSNAQQIPMIFDDRPQLTPLPGNNEVATWLLLVYPVFGPESIEGSSALGSHVAWSELSLPSEMDENGYVTEWAERIFLTPVRLDGMPLRQPKPEPEDDEVDIQVFAR